MGMFGEAEGNPLSVDLGSGGGKWARLLLYSPRTYNDQVIRPFVYGFSDKTANFLLAKGDKLDDAASRADVMRDEKIAGILKPDMNGTQLSMDTYSQLWTFTLLVHQDNNYFGSGALAAGGGKTIVYTGHCIPEPVLPSSLYLTTPQINKDCELFVHSREVIRNNAPSVSAFGMLAHTDILSNDDFIDGSMQLQVKNTDPAAGTELFLMTPGNVLENFSPDITGGISTSGQCAISNKRTAVQSGLKSPGVHLHQILQGIDATVENAKAAEYSPRGLDSCPATFTAFEDPDKFKEDLKHQFDNMAGAAAINHGLPADGIFSIADVERLYPGLVVSVQQINPMAQFEVLPQNMINKRVCYSSFASSAITAIAADVGLSSISFQFTSFNPSRRNELDKSSFAVVAENAFLMCPPKDKSMYDMTLKGAVEMFREKFKREVVPFIVGVCGDFFIQATYSNNSETQVNLQFLDDSASTNGGGIFECPNRLGSMSTVSVGKEDMFNGNGFALNQFMLTVQGQAGTAGMKSSSTGMNFGSNGAGDTSFLDAVAPVKSPLEGVLSGI